jgi:hypothetical protein
MNTGFLIDEMDLFATAVNGIGRAFYCTNCASGTFFRINGVRE